MPACTEYDHPSESRGHRGLRHDGAEGRAGDAEAEPVHQQQVEDDVPDGTGDRDHQRSPSVLQPT